MATAAVVMKLNLSFDRTDDGGKPFLYLSSVLRIKGCEKSDDCKIIVATH